MSPLQKLERLLRPVAIANLTYVLIAGQLIGFIAVHTGAVDYDTFLLIPERVADGEIWRLFTFLFAPLKRQIFWMLISCYIMHWIGMELENKWGYVKFNIYVLAGFFCTIIATYVAAGMLDDPGVSATNLFLYQSFFLAFAFLFPEMEIYLIVFPIRVKWLGYFVWIQLGLIAFNGGSYVRIFIAAALVNFLLFFGRDLLLRLKSQKRRMKRQADQIRMEHQAFHTCRVCGKTDKSHPDMEFRYCPNCDGEAGYCEEHITQHECVREDKNK